MQSLLPALIAGAGDPPRFASSNSSPLNIRNNTTKCAAVVPLRTLAGRVQGDADDSRGNHSKDGSTRARRIVLCVRLYLGYPLSYEHVAELAAERGVEVDASCIWCPRWLPRLTMSRKSIRLPGIIEGPI